MAKNKIDLSDIKEKSLEETTTFTDLMSRREKRKRKKDLDLNDIEEMVNEKRRNTQDLTNETKKAKENLKNKRDIEVHNKKEKVVANKNNIDLEEKLNNTQILELTRKMKFNFDDVKDENNESKKNGITLLNLIGIINLICIGYYIYLLAFSSYQDNENNYMIAGIFIISLVFFFGLSLVCNKKLRKAFNIINILIIILFIIFNIYTYFK